MFILLQLISLLYFFMNFKTIYHNNKDNVFNLALHYVQNVEDAQEITQDVFVSVHQNLEKYRNEANISTWIYRITINKCLDFIKAKQRKKRFVFITSLFGDDQKLKHDVATFEHPGMILEDEEALNELFQQINDLPDNQKTVLILSKIEQKSQAEVAEIMQISVKAVEALFQRAKNNLEKKLL